MWWIVGRGPVPVEDCCMFFLSSFFCLCDERWTFGSRSARRRRGKKKMSGFYRGVGFRSSFFSSLQVLDPEADVPRRLGPGHRVEGCWRSTELVLGVNLEVGGGMEVRVTVRLGSPLGQTCPTPLRAPAKVAAVYLQSQRCHSGMHATGKLIHSFWTTGFIVSQSLPTKISH